MGVYLLGLEDAGMKTLVAQMIKDILFDRLVLRSVDELTDLPFLDDILYLEPFSVKQWYNAPGDSSFSLRGERQFPGFSRDAS